MTKIELVERLADRIGVSLQGSRRIVDAVFAPDPAVGLIATELLAGHKVKISGFGTFEARFHKPRIGRNSQTGKPLYIRGRRTPAFRPGRPLKETVRASDPDLTAENRS